MAPFRKGRKYNKPRKSSKRSVYKRKVSKSSVAKIAKRSQRKYSRDR